MISRIEEIKMDNKMDKTKIVFKIRNTETGLYSKGGLEPEFNKIGKTWNNLGHVKNALNLYETGGTQPRTIPNNWEIVAYKLEVIKVGNAYKIMHKQPPKNTSDANIHPNVNTQIPKKGVNKVLQNKPNKQQNFNKSNNRQEV